MKLKFVLCENCVVEKQLGLHPEKLMDKRTDDTLTIQGFNAWNSPIGPIPIERIHFQVFYFFKSEFLLFKSKTKFISIDWSYYFVTFIVVVYSCTFGRIFVSSVPRTLKTLRN